jgi:hypothetical protein
MTHQKGGYTFAALQIKHVVVAIMRAKEKEEEKERHCFQRSSLPFRQQRAHSPFLEISWGADLT